MFFIVVDAYLKLPEVVPMRTTKAEKTMDALRNIFARNGVLRQVVSDNEPQFVSKQSL